MRPRPAARSCSMAPVTRSCDSRTGRSSRRSTSSCGALTSDATSRELGPEGGELSRLLPDLAQRVGGAAGSGRGRPRHRAPPSAQRGCRPSRRRWYASAAGRSSSRMGTGPTRRRSCFCGTWRAARRTRVPSWSRRSATPRPKFRSRSPRRSSTCAARKESCGCDWEGSAPRRSPSSCGRAVGGDLGPDLPEVARVLARADRRQRVPDDRAVAHRCSRPRASSVYDGGTRLARARCRSRQPRGCAGGRQPAAGAAERGDHEPARAGRRRRTRSSISRPLAARRAGRRGAARGARAGGRARHDRGGAGSPARLPVHP